MRNVLIAIAMLTMISIAVADEPATSPVEKYLQAGAYGDGETALLLQLDLHPDDDEARFGLGVLQFLRSIETVGQTLYEYGASANHLAEPFPRLPIPQNDNPSTISYQELRRVLEVFSADLMRADETLSKVSNSDVKMKIRLSHISFDFAKTGKQKVTVAEILSKLHRGPPLLQKANPDLLFHFDRGDVAWLRAYCHLLAAMSEGTLAVEWSEGFNRWLGDLFPKRELHDANVPVTDFFNEITLREPFRLRRLRLHSVALCELNREAWKYIREEKDDDFEWLAHPKQTDQLGIPLTDEQINVWLKALAEVEGMCKGERLLPNSLLRIVEGTPDGKGLNVRKVLDDPHRDFFNWDRIQKEGWDPKYLEDEKNHPPLDIMSFLRVLSLFNGPFGVAQAVRMN